MPHSLCKCGRCRPCDLLVWRSQRMCAPCEAEVRFEGRIHIRWLIRRDMPEVLSIEESLDFLIPAEDSGFIHLSWTEEDILAVMRQRTHIGMVAEIGCKVVGYMIYVPRKPQLSLLRLAVHPHYRRCGVGSQMVSKLKGKLSNSRTRIELEVREDNAAALCFWSRQGFAATQVIRRREGRDDIAMRYMAAVEEHDYGGGD